jgi:hypothetical protein
MSFLQIPWVNHVLFLLIDQPEQPISFVNSIDCLLSPFELFQLSSLPPSLLFFGFAEVKLGGRLFGHIFLFRHDRLLLNWFEIQLFRAGEII